MTKISVGSVSIERAFENALIIRHGLSPNDSVCIGLADAKKVAKAIMEIADGEEKRRRAKRPR